MSTPISAISSEAVTVSTTGDVNQASRLRRERADRLLDPGVEFGDLGADAVAVIEHHLQDHRVVIGEEAAQRLLEPVGLFARMALSS